MKSIKLICFALVAVLLCGCLMACGNTPAETTAPETTQATQKRDPLKVNVIVRSSEKGENVYASDSVAGYLFIGDVISPLAIVEEFMSFEYDVEVTYGEDERLKKVGTIEPQLGQLWLWSYAKAPLGADEATAQESNIGSEAEIGNGDTIILYLSDLK